VSARIEWLDDDAVGRLAREAGRRFTREFMQPAVDRVFETHAGRSREEVLAALVEEGAEPDASWVTQAATLIAEGRKISYVFETDESE